MERFLVVRLAGRQFAIPALRVLAMSRARSVALSPAHDAEPRRYKAHVEGAEVTVHAPHAYLGLPQTEIKVRSCVLVIDKGQALLVDSVSRFEEVPSAGVRNGVEVRIGEKWCPVLDLDEMLKAIAA